MRRIVYALRLALVLIAIPASSVVSQEMDLPASIQAPLILKIASFDRRLASRAGDEVVVAVVYQGGYRTSARSRDELLQSLAGPTTVAGRTVRTLSIDIDTKSLAAELEKEKPLIVYVAPLRGMDIATIAAATRTAGATTITGVVRHFADGLAVGLGVKGERPRIMINLTQSRLEGADFRSDLLRLAQVSR